MDSGLSGSHGMMSCSDKWWQNTGESALSVLKLKIPSGYFVVICISSEQLFLTIISQNSLLHQINSSRILSAWRKRTELSLCLVLLHFVCFQCKYRYTTCEGLRLMIWYLILNEAMSTDHFNKLCPPPQYFMVKSLASLFLPPWV